MNYQDFILGKAQTPEKAGWDIGVDELHHDLFDFQKHIVKWAIGMGRCAVFADCGLGKTRIQLDWANHVATKTLGRVLICAPLAVAEQTHREGNLCGVPVTVCRSKDDIDGAVNITNYERLQHFDPKDFTGIVLDESSILKNFSGVYRKELQEFAKDIHYRLCCTATPAPNDLIEITNHAEFLDVMTGKECVALFFIQDGNTTHKWRLKNHAREDFWAWMASWSVAVRKPSDIGYDDGGFILPPCESHQHTVDGKTTKDYLFPVEAVTLGERQGARRETVIERAELCADLVNASDDTWLVWCNLNYESEALAKLIPDAVEVKGSDTQKHKTDAMLGFTDGNHRVMVSKPSICGFGMNWQHCANVAFVGLSDSWEQYYQAVRRCWRFGQKNKVNVHIICAETEGRVVANIQRKEKQASDMFDGITAHINKAWEKGGTKEMSKGFETEEGDRWKLYLGDSVETVKQIEDNSVGLSVFSPPFPGMYAYTNSANDIGNTNSIEEFMRHFEYLIDDIKRVLMPGRMCCVHLCQLTAMLSRDGYIGLKDYRGKTIELFESHGFPYAGEVTIDKNPQVQAVRNKERGLLFKTLSTDSSKMRMALADYVIYFRKPGENPHPIESGQSERYNPGGGWISQQEWIEWAAPVWYRQVEGMKGGISEGDVLSNFRHGKGQDDEKHLCPLQLGVIERCVKLWSAPDELVYSPFTGIGSEGYKSVRLGRRFVGGELKDTYFNVAVGNLKRAQHEWNNRDMELLAGIEGVANV